jgi:hypothetical protein
MTSLVGIVVTLLLAFVLGVLCTLIVSGWKAATLPIPGSANSRLLID